MIFYFGKESWQAKEGNESLPKKEKKGQSFGFNKVT